MEMMISLSMYDFESMYFSFKVKDIMKKLGIQFYDREDVVAIAKELIGKIIMTKFGGVTCAGRIVETEAYIGLTDKASHSFGGKRTARNEHMYASPATSYVYICYGMHHLFNVVTNKKDVPDAVLIRAVEPIQGIKFMLKRTNKKQLDNTLTKGPGNVGKAMGISKAHSGLNLLGSKIFIVEDELTQNKAIPGQLIGSSKRIGVESAGAAALLPYRFYLKGNKYVSGSPSK
jgi:DNA-3-methyladenine glycosylase